MKTIFWLIAVIYVSVLTSCSGSDSELSSENSSFISIKDAYGFETISSYSISESDKIPSVSLMEMQSVLEALRVNSNKQNVCVIEESGTANFGSANEKNRKVIMGSEYTAKTRAGSVLENFLLRVELKFNYDGNQVYYYGTDYKYNSALFDWRANGLSLNPAKKANGLTYEFESESYLYFKVVDEGNCLVKVGILFKGTFDFQSGAGTYSFQLQRCDK